MSTAKIFLIVALALIVIVVVAAFLAQQRRTRTQDLQGKFGKEYDRTVEAQGDRQAAERDLRERQARRSTFEVRELDPARRQQHTESWDRLQGQFVDDPATAVTSAFRLVRTVMSERGYPTEDFEQQADVVSVDHPEVVGDYREAVRISEANGRGEATTEDLREAMVRYRSLFSSLLDTHDSGSDEQMSG